MKQMPKEGLVKAKSGLGWTLDGNPKEKIK